MPYHVDSLWSKGTLLVPPLSESAALHVQAEQNYFLAGIMAVLLIILILSSHEIRNIVPYLFKSLFRYKYLLKIEEKLLLASQRNIVSFVSFICFPLFIVFCAGEFLSGHTGIPVAFITAYLFAVIILYRIFKGVVLLTIGWAVKEKKPFLFIGKIGCNYFSVLFFTAIPCFVFFMLSKCNPLILIKTLIILSIIVYTIYLARIRQVIISARFSHFFYILYLCTIELLPLVLIIKFLSGYK